jgi:hypothetical protein
VRSNSPLCAGATTALEIRGIVTENFMRALAGLRRTEHSHRGLSRKTSLKCPLWVFSEIGERLKDVSSSPESGNRNQQARLPRMTNSDLVTCRLLRRDVECALINDLKANGLVLIALALDDARLVGVLEMKANDQGAPRNKDCYLCPRPVRILFEGIAG